jgi:acyl-CoA thioester hydrolase
MTISFTTNQYRGELSHRVAYADTDAGGVVYHARYIEWAERSRLEWLHTMGWSVKRLMSEYGVVLVVRGLQAQYFIPALLEDELLFYTKVKSLGHVKIDLETIIMRDQKIMAQISVELVCVSFDGMSLGGVARIPSKLLEILRTDLTETFI